MRFLAADALTGRIVGQLEPLTWEFTDPLTGSGDASLELAVTDSTRDRVADLTTPLRRQLAIGADDGTILFGGPIQSPPERGDDRLVKVPFVDWRAWWYRARIWPNSDGSRRDVFAADEDQATILARLAAIGKSHPAAPANMAVDTPAAAGITRTKTFRMFASVGDSFDEIARAVDGPDWWTYLVADARTVTPHLAFAYPFRVSRRDPVVVRFQVGEGGNGRGFQWPSGQERANVVYGLGSAAPPDQGWAVAEHDSITSSPPAELVWPEVLNLPSGILTAAQAFEHVLARLDALAKSDGTVTVTVDPTRPDVASYATGDLARLVVDDGWRSLDVATARIVSRTVRGVGEHVREVQLTLDLGFDPSNPDAGIPGEDDTGREEG